MSDNRAAVLDINEGVGRWGYVDGTGRLAIECRYADARRFADGLAAVQVPEGAWGYIDTVGRLVIAPQFVLAEPFEDGMAWVQAAGELWGRVDKSGEDGYSLPVLRNRRAGRAGLDACAARRQVGAICAKTAKWSCRATTT